MFMCELFIPQSKCGSSVEIQPLCHRVQLGSHVHLRRRLHLRSSGCCFQVRFIQNKIQNLAPHTNPLKGEKRE